MRTVERLSEEYREKLGLKSWAEHAQDTASRLEAQRDRLSPEAFEAYKERQTGRTTRGLLRTIAQAVIRGSEILVIQGLNDHHEKLLVGRAREMVSMLGLDLKIVAYRCSKTVHYVDHVVTEG